MLSRTARWLLPAALLAHAPLWAIEPDSSAGPPLTLSEAVSRTLQSNPDLAAFGFELRAQDGLRQQAALAPNPELVLDVEDAFGTGDRHGFSAAQTTLSLRQVIERGALQGRVAAAEAGRGLLDADLAERRLDAAAEAARRFIRVLSDQERLRLTHEGGLLAERAVEAARKRVLTAKAPEAEVIRAEAALARTLLEHEDVEHELLTSRHELAALWGQADPAFGLAQGEVLKLPAMEPFEVLVARISANPSLLKFASQQRLREAELRLAEQRRRQPWTVTAGLRRFEDGDDFAAVAGITVPLPWKNRAQGDIAAAQARLAQVDASHSATEIQVRTRLFAWVQELGHTRHVAQTLDEQVLPRMTEALKQTEYAYERGRYGYLELVAAQRELLDVKRARIQAAVDAYGYANEIDRLTGVAFGAPEDRLTGTALRAPAAPATKSE